MQWIQVTVGAGGAGSSAIFSCPYPHPQNSQAGGTSSFETYLSAAGGEVSSGSTTCYKGLSGGSGGGAGEGCVVYATSQSGMGGTDGSSGAIATSATCSDLIPGTGQGSFVPYLNIFTRNVFTPGPGGMGEVSC